MPYLSPAQQEKLKKGLNIFGPDFTNSQGQTMAEANAPSSWQDGTYIGRKTNIITPDSLQNEDNLNLPNVNQEENSASTMNSIPSIEDIYKGNESETATEYDKMTNDYLKLFETYGVEKPKAQAKEEEKAGLPQYESQLTDINNQINALKSEALSIPLKTEASMMGRASVGAIAGESKARLRENTVKALQLSSVQQTILGNISYAQKQADKAVELEFAPMQAKIDYLKEALRVNENKLTREEAKQAKIQDVKLAERQTLLDQQKEDKKTIMGFIAEAQKNGANTTLLNQAMKQTDPQQALLLLSQYMVDPIARQKEILDLEKTRAETKKLQAEAEKKGEPVTQVVNNTLLEYNPDKNQWEIIYKGDATKPLTVSEKIALQDKGYELDANGNIIQAAGVPEAKVEQATSIVQSIDDLLSNNNWKKAVGPVSDIMPGWTSGARNAARADIQAIIDNIAIENLSKLKGPMSDKDVAFIRSASTGLNANMDETEFEKRIKKIKDRFNDIKLKAGYQKEFPNATEQELDDLLQEEKKRSLNNVGSDTNGAVSKAINVPDNSKGGQCGRFVNKYTGLGLGDSYQSKLAKMDSSITYPEPGMVFVMPYSWTGHTGFIERVNNDGTVTVKDSNWFKKTKPGKVATHKIPIAKITGLKRV